MHLCNHVIRRVIAGSLMLIALAAFATVQASAAPPDPGNSSCPTAATVAFDGSCCFDVIVRDAINNPVSGSTVVVDFANCPLTALCISQPPGLVVNGNTISTTTDASGVAHFCFCADISTPCTVQISADGVLLCSVPVATDCSPTPNRTSCWGRLKVLYR